MERDGLPEPPDDEIMRRLRGILEYPRVTNDYKFALAGFLLEYSKKGKGGCVSYDEVARHMLGIYWKQTRLRHSRNDPEKDVSAITGIMERNLGGSYMKSIGTLEKEKHDEVEKCKDEMFKSFFRYVIPRFQKVDGTEVKERDIIFEWKSTGPLGDKAKRGWPIPLEREYGIVISPDAVEVIDRNRKELSCLLTRGWTKFLENLNPGVPNILKKVEGSTRRTSLRAERRVLEKHFGLKCFYCRKEFGDLKEMDADHVLPFRYMGEDELWNLVLAGRGCNSSKSALLPKKIHIDKLKVRNEESRSGIPALGRSVNRLGGDLGLITKHYRNAISDGLGTWNGKADCRVLETEAWQRRGRRPAPPAATRPA